MHPSVRVKEAAPVAVGVTAARGFRAAGLHCGIRKTRDDLALVVSDVPAACAAVFTRNRVVAAPVTVSKAHLSESRGWIRAIVVNSGNANACTGDHGMDAAATMATDTARLLGVEPCRVLVSSTGVIGQRLPIERIVGALPRLVGALTEDGGAEVSRAILTTDTRAKLSVRTVDTPSGTYTVGGMAKGSGMIHPDMATTLGFVTTDAAVEPEALQALLRRAVDRSFHCITVDGDTSTNDMVAVLANGASGVDIASPDDLATFEAALTGVLADLARQVAADGEGATRLIEVVVTGARTEADAAAVARTIAGSPLVKTAVHGADANWGRILAAAGRAGVEFDPAEATVAIGGVEVLSPGYVSEFSEELASARMRAPEVVLDVDLGCGPGRAVAWTCDLSARYVEINGSYRT